MNEPIRTPLCQPSEHEEGEAFDAAIYPLDASTLLWPKPYGYLDRMRAMQRIKAAHEKARKEETDA